MRYNRHGDQNSRVHTAPTSARCERHHSRGCQVSDVLPQSRLAGTATPIPLPMFSHADSRQRGSPSCQGWRVVFSRAGEQLATLEVQRRWPCLCCDATHRSTTFPSVGSGRRGDPCAGSANAPGLSWRQSLRRPQHGHRRSSPLAPRQPLRPVPDHGDPAHASPGEEGPV